MTAFVAASGLMEGSGVAPSKPKAFDYVGIPYPTDPQPKGDPFPYDPCLYTPDRPAGWTSSPNDSVSGYYYVDNSHPSATDTIQGGEPTDAYGRRFGSPGIPRNTFPGPGLRQLTVDAGAYVEIHGGPYGAGLPVDQNRAWLLNGTANQPVFITGSQSGTRTTMKCGAQLLGSQYYIIEGFQWGPSADSGEHKNAMRFGGTQFGCLRDAVGIDLPGPAVSTNYSLFNMGGSNTYNIVLWKVDVVRLSADGQNANWADTDLDRHGIALANASGYTPGDEMYNIWIIDGYSDELAGDYVQVTNQDFDQLTLGVDDQAAVDSVQHLYIAGCEGRFSRQGTVALKTCSKVVLSQNKIVGMRAYVVGNPTGYGLGCWYSGGHNSFFILNEMYSCEVGLRVTSANYLVNPGNTNAQKNGYRIFWLGNLVHHNFHDDVDAIGGSSERDSGISFGRTNAVGGKWYAAFNTFHDVSAGFATGSGGVSDMDIYTWSNIFSELNSHPNQTQKIYNIRAEEGTCRWLSSNNLFTNPNKPFLYTDSGQFANLSAAQASGRETNSIDASAGTGNEVKFVNPVNDEFLRDFSLQAGSGAIDNASLTAPDGTDPFNVFETIFGLDIRVDFLRKVRPSGGGWDIGAYERQ